eukprot:1989578-Amphidinium_carterae.1
MSLGAGAPTDEEPGGEHAHVQDHVAEWLVRSLDKQVPEDLGFEPVEMAAGMLARAANGSTLTKVGEGAVAHRGVEDVEVEAVGGLKDAARTVGKLPILREAGRCLREVLEKLIRGCDNFRGEVCTMSHRLGREGCVGFSADIVHAVRLKLAEHLETNELDVVSESGIRVGLLRAWSTACSDPDGLVADWLLDGCPLGDDAGAIPTSGVFPVMSGPSHAVVKSA